MSNPFDSQPGNNDDANKDNSSNGNDGGFGNGSSGNGGYGYGGEGNMPRYEPTNHPEDMPGYGAAPGLPAYGAYSAQGNQYQAPTGPAAGPLGAAPSATAAISWGFKATFRNAKLWVLGALLCGAITMAVSAALGAMGANSSSSAGGPGGFISEIMTTLVTTILVLIAMRLALYQIDDPTTGWSHVGKNVKWLQPFVIMIVVQIVVAICISGLVLAFVGAEFFNTLNADATQISDDDLLFMLGRLMGVIFVVALVGFFIQPLYTLMVWFAADGNSIGDSIRMGFAAGKKNYGQLLLLTLLTFLLSLLGIVTLLLGFLVILPAIQLATAYIYRQCAASLQSA